MLSGSLFNFFINELTELCCNANVGAKFIEIIVWILIFCDDICLLSDSIEEMQILLNLCEEFANSGVLNIIWRNINIKSLVK